MDFTNITMNATFDPVATYSLEFQPLEILNALTSVASVLANTLIIYVIARFSVMRTRSNVYLANWCICNFIVTLLVPASLNLFGLVDMVSYEYMCIWDETLYGVLFGNLLFVVILLLDWYIVTYTRQTCSVRCKQIHLFVIAIVWIVIVSISVASITFCMLSWSYPLTLVCFLLGYLVIFVVIISVYILRCIKIKIFKELVEKSKVELIIVTSYFLCWLPNWITMYGQLFLNFFLSFAFEQFTFFLGYSHAWVMLILLYMCDKAFKMHLRKVFGAKESSGDETNVNKEQSRVLI